MIRVHVENKGYPRGCFAFPRRPCHCRDNLYRQINVTISATQMKLECQPLLALEFHTGETRVSQVGNCSAIRRKLHSSPQRSMNCDDARSSRSAIQLHEEGDELSLRVICIAYFANFVARAVRGEELHLLRLRTLRYCLHLQYRRYICPTAPPPYCVEGCNANHKLKSWQQKSDKQMDARS